MAVKVNSSAADGYSGGSANVFGRLGFPTGSHSRFPAREICLASHQAALFRSDKAAPARNMRRALAPGAKLGFRVHYPGVRDGGEVSRCQALGKNAGVHAG